MLSLIPHDPFHKGRCCVRIRRQHFVDQDPRSLCKRGDLLLQNLNATGVGPIVEDGAEEVERRPFGRLLLENVVRHEVHAILHGTGDPFGAHLNDVGEILNDEGKVREPLGQADAHGTIGPAYVNDRGFAERCPVVLLVDWVHRDLGRSEIHRIPVPGGALGVFLQEVIQAKVRSIGQAETLPEIDLISRRNDGWEPCYYALSGSLRLTVFDRRVHNLG